MKLPKLPLPKIDPKMLLKSAAKSAAFGVAVVLIESIFKEWTKPTPTAKAEDLTDEDFDTVPDMDDNDSSES